jgi:hypothetical protein
MVPGFGEEADDSRQAPHAPIGSAIPKKESRTDLRLKWRKIWGRKVQHSPPRPCVRILKRMFADNPAKPCAYRVQLLRIYMDIVLV